MSKRSKTGRRKVGALGSFVPVSFLCNHTATLPPTYTYTYAHMPGPCFRALPAFLHENDPSEVALYPWLSVAGISTLLPPCPSGLGMITTSAVEYRRLPPSHAWCPGCPHVCKQSFTKSLQLNPLNGFSVSCWCSAVVNKIQHLSALKLHIT